MRQAASACISTLPRAINARVYASKRHGLRAQVGEPAGVRAVVDALAAGDKRAHAPAVTLLCLLLARPRAAPRAAALLQVCAPARRSAVPASAPRGLRTRHPGAVPGLQGACTNSRPACAPRQGACQASCASAMRKESLTPDQEANMALRSDRTYLSLRGARMQGERGVVSGALALLDAPAPAAAAKGLVALAARASPRFLAQALRGRLLPQVGRPARPGRGQRLGHGQRPGGWPCARLLLQAAAQPGLEQGQRFMYKGRNRGGTALPGAYAAFHACSEAWGSPVLHGGLPRGGDIRQR
jgi:hypothetical protein